MNEINSFYFNRKKNNRLKKKKLAKISNKE